MSAEAAAADNPLEDLGHSASIEMQRRRRKRWRRAWMVFRSGFGLAFYKNSKEYELEGQISLRSIYSLQAIPIAGRSNCLCLTYRRPRAKPSNNSSGSVQPTDGASDGDTSDGSSADEDSDNNSSVPATDDTALSNDKVGIELDYIFIDPGSRSNMEEWINKISSRLLMDTSCSLISWHPLPSLTSNVSLTYVARPGFISLVGPFESDQDYRWWIRSVSSDEGIFIYDNHSTTADSKRSVLFQLPSKLSGINEEPDDNQTTIGNESGTNHCIAELCGPAGSILSSYLYKKKRKFRAFSSNTYSDAAGEIAANTHFFTPDVLRDHQRLFSSPDPAPSATQHRDIIESSVSARLPCKIRTDFDSWSARWCVLRSSQLLWYSDQTEYEVLEIIDLKQVIMIVALPDDTLQVKGTKNALKARVMKWIQRRREQKKAAGSSDRMSEINFNPKTSINDECTCDWCRFGKEWSKSVNCDKIEIIFPPPGDSAHASIGLYWAILAVWHNYLVSVPIESYKHKTSNFVDGLIGRLSPQGSVMIDRLRSGENPLLDMLIAIVAGQNISHNSATPISYLESPVSPSQTPEHTQELKLYPLQIITLQKRYYFATYNYEMLEEWMCMLRKAFIRNRNH